MIGKITGILDYKALDHVLIDVRGVGYIVHCADATLARLPAAGAPVALYTDFVVREDSQTLFGFPTLKEKEWHRLLTTVQGVGAKASLAILSTLGTDGVSRAIALGDWSAVKSAKGIGPKIAQRVVSELKDKAPAIMAMSDTPPASSNIADQVEVTPPVQAEGGAAKASAPSPMPTSDLNAQADAMSALTNLGYSPSQAAGAVAQVTAQTPDASSASLIKSALKLLAPKD